MDEGSQWPLKDFFEVRAQQHKAILAAIEFLKPVIAENEFCQG